MSGKCLTSARGAKTSSTQFLLSQKKLGEMESPVRVLHRMVKDYLVEVAIGSEVSTRKFKVIVSETHLLLYSFFLFAKPKLTDDR